MWQVGEGLLITRVNVEKRGEYVGKRG